MTFLLIQTTVWSFSQPIEKEKLEEVKKHLLTVYPSTHPHDFMCNHFQCVGIGTTNKDQQVATADSWMEEQGATLQIDDEYHRAYWIKMGVPGSVIAKRSYIEFDVFYNLSFASQMLLIYIGKTVPQGSSVSSEELLLEDFKDEQNQILATIQEVEQALNELESLHYLRKQETQRGSQTLVRYSITRAMYVYITVTLPEEWQKQA